MLFSRMLPQCTKRDWAQAETTRYAKRARNHITIHLRQNNNGNRATVSHILATRLANTEKSEMRNTRTREKEQTTMSTTRKQLRFSTWKVLHFNLTLLELEIADHDVTVYIRTGHRIFKWEWDRKARKAALHD